MAQRVSGEKGRGRLSIEIIKTSELSSFAINELTVEALFRSSLQSLSLLIRNFKLLRKNYDVARMLINVN